MTYQVMVKAYTESQMSKIYNWATPCGCVTCGTPYGIRGMTQDYFSPYEVTVPAYIPGCMTGPCGPCAPCGDACSPCGSPCGSPCATGCGPASNCPQMPGGLGVVSGGGPCGMGNPVGTCTLENPCNSSYFTPCAGGCGPAAGILGPSACSPGCAPGSFGNPCGVGPFVPDPCGSGNCLPTGGPGMGFGAVWGSCVPACGVPCASPCTSPCASPCGKSKCGKKCCKKKCCKKNCKKNCKKGCCKMNVSYDGCGDGVCIDVCPPVSVPLVCPPPPLIEPINPCFEPWVKNLPWLVRTNAGKYDLPVIV